MGKFNLMGYVAVIALCGAVGVQAQNALKKPPVTALTPEIQKHLDESIRLAAGLPGSYITELYTTTRRSNLVEASLLPPPNGWETETGKHPNLKPTKMFDQLYYFGNDYVGSFVLVTGDGIIQWDTMDNADEAQNIIEADYKAVGLDPSNIKYIVLTHGHADHFGGANYFKEKYPKIRILESQADWQLMANTKPRPNSKVTPPSQDGIITDGEKLTLGGTTVTFYVTPGHTPGTVSSIIPVTDHGTPHVLAMFGGVGFPLHIAPSATAGGLDEYARQWKRFGAIAKAAGADGVISTHPGFDGTVTNIDKMAVRKAGDPNPWVLGKDGYDRYLKVNVEASEAIRGIIQLTGGN